jgi:hypothetical protein
MGYLFASSPSSPRQILSRCVRSAGVGERSLTGVHRPGVYPPIGLRKRSVPVASALHSPKSVLRGTLQNMRRAVWREKSRRLARLLHPVA